MLADATHAIHLISMSISLWMAFYLFARGYPNRTTLRAVLALFAIATFFLGTYNYMHGSPADTAPLRAALLVIALACWYSATFTLLSPEKQNHHRWMAAVIHTLQVVSILLLVFGGRDAMRESGSLLTTAKLEANLPSILYGIAQIVTAFGVLFNLTVQEEIRLALEGKSYLLASIALVLALIYGIVSLVIEAQFPRIIEDGLVFAGIFLLGLSVARHQSLIERRAIWQDFPIAMLGMTGIASFYFILGVWLQIPAAHWATLLALIVTTHSMHDLGREAVERWRAREESRLRRTPPLPSASDENALRLCLDQKLTLLLRALNSSGGLIALWRHGGWIVVSSRDSLPVDAELPAIPAAAEGVFRVDDSIAPLAWASQSFEGMQSIALIGVGRSKTKLDYSSGDLDLLDEFTDQIGTLVSVSRAGAKNIQPAADRVSTEPILTQESDRLKIVEEALRRFGDYVFLGQSPLADRLLLTGDSQIERGKKTQTALKNAVQSLRPEGERPPEPLPREWYNYVVLHDAYIKGVPNREVMARLYVSEGTFHRIRRHAVRGVARCLAEKM